MALIYVGSRRFDIIARFDGAVGNSMRIFFSVGEPSGDLHASNLIRELRSYDPDLKAVGFAGPKMQAEGCESLSDLTQLGVMYLAGALRHIRLFLRLIADADSYFKANQVDAVVLIDYPGMNWWIARKAKRHKIPVFYYGVPQMWAWAAWRIRKIRRFVDHVICKLPFEPKWFADRNCRAFYVGHPYFDQLHEQELDETFVGKRLAAEGPMVLLLPGSRKIELNSNLKTLVSAGDEIRQEISDVRLAVGCLNAQHAEMCRPICERFGVEVFIEKTQELMQVADACIACSGSVSLELLYHRLPTVIVYQIGWLKLVLHILVVKCKYITLPNLMSSTDIRKTRWWPYNPDAVDAESVLMPEYVSVKDCSRPIARRITKWLKSPAEISAKRQELERLAEQYAIPGATSRAASYIISELGNHAGNKVAA